MSVSTLIPAAFPAFALAHFLALLSPGPDFFLIIGHAVRHRLRGSLFICLGIALGNALYICLAVSGWSVMRQMPALYRVLELAGAAYLAWLGFLLLRASREIGLRSREIQDAGSRLGHLPMPFMAQLVNGNSLIGARRECYDKEQLTATAKGLHWYDAEPKRIMPGKQRNKKNQIYHFLLGDPGMSKYDDKVIRKLEPDHVAAIKKWNKEFTKPYTGEEVNELMELSQTIDALFKD